MKARFSLVLAGSVLFAVAPRAAAQDTAPPPDPNAPPLDPNAPAPDPNDAYEDNDPSALADFHATLDPNGSWADDPTYGTVWVPNVDIVGPDFVPYASGGHWTYGNDYTWVSDYDWGWAPFHYGRWVYADGRGWSWIPGREYAPAWVDWRIGNTGNPYVGWAPAAPTFIWRGGVAVNVGFPVVPHFVFCGGGDVFHPHVFERLVRGPRVDAIAVHMHPFDEHPWGGGRRFFGPAPERLGIRPEHVVRYTGHEPGMVHACEFARPSMAVRYGAHPPLRPLEHAGVRPGERPVEHRVERPHVDVREHEQVREHADVHERVDVHEHAGRSAAPSHAAPSHAAPSHGATPRHGR